VRWLPARSWVVVAVVAMSSMVVAAPGAAHEGEGAIEVLAAAAAGPRAVEYTIRLTYAADGHGANDATVTAVVVGGDGAVVGTPAVMERGDGEGVYVATVSFPAEGRWTVRFTAVTPPATLEVGQTIEEPGAPASTTMTPATAAPPATAAEAPASTPRGAGGEGDATAGGGGAPWPVVVALAAPAAGAALLLGVRRARRSARAG
jgi:hypothetical protein